MQKKHISKLFYSVALSVFLSASPAFAVGFPTLDLTEVFNTITSAISQVQSQIATIQETLSISNIQQAIGDKLGGLAKIKDLKAKAAKAKEKLEKAQKRAQKVIELKKKYEQEVQNAISQVQDKYNQAVNTVNDVKNQVEGVKNQAINTVNDVKNQVEGVKNQVEGAVNDVKNQVEGVKNQVEGAVNDVKNQVEGVKNQVENTVNDVKNKVDNAKNTANDLYGNLQSGFKKEGSAGNASTGSAASGSTEVVPWQFGEGESESGFDFEPTSNNESIVLTPPSTSASTSVISSDRDTQNSALENGGSTIVMPAEIDDLWADNGNVELSAGPTVNVSTGKNLAVVKEEKPVAAQTETPKSEVDLKSDSLPAEEKVTIPLKPALMPTGEALKGEDAIVLGPVNTKTEMPSADLTPTFDAGKAATPAVAPTTKPVLNKGMTTRKAFEKISYVDVYQQGFAAEAKFATGTDDDANYYFPDTFALWTGINFDDKVDEEKMEKVISTICSDLNSSDDTTKAEYVNQYNKLLAEARAHAEAYSAAAVKESESTKTIEDLENMQGKLDSMLDQMSGSGEILTSEVEQNKRELVMMADNIQSEVFEELLHYCNIYQPEGK